MKWRPLDDPAGYAWPVLAELGGRQQWLAFTAAALAGLNPDSAETLWRVPVATSFGRHITPPRAVGDLVLVSSHQAGLLAVRAALQSDGGTAALAWVAKTHAIHCAPFVALGRHLCGLGPSRRMLCADAATGARLRAKKTSPARRSRPMGSVGSPAMTESLRWRGTGAGRCSPPVPQGFARSRDRWRCVARRGAPPRGMGGGFISANTSLLAIDRLTPAVTSPPLASP